MRSFSQYHQSNQSISPRLMDSRASSPSTRAYLDHDYTQSKSANSIHRPTMQQSYNSIVAQTQDLINESVNTGGAKQLHLQQTLKKLSDDFQSARKESLDAVSRKKIEDKIHQIEDDLKSDLVINDLRSGGLRYSASDSNPQTVHGIDRDIDSHLLPR